MGDKIEDRIQVVEQLVADKGTMTVSTKLMKYAIGILIGGTLSILSFAWGLYIKTDGEIKKTKTIVIGQLAKDKEEILTKIKELDEKEVKPNTDKNHDQDLDIVRLLERVNSKYQINNNYNRPPSLTPTVPSTQRIEVEQIFIDPSRFESQNVVNKITDTPPAAPNSSQTVVE